MYAIVRAWSTAPVRKDFFMKIVLAAINAKYIHSNLAVYSLKDSAWAEGVDISIEEFTINNYIDEILARLYKSRPDILAFSCYIWNISMVEELADLLGKVLPETSIWVGGPEVSYDAGDVLKRNPAIDLVMCGEGEETFRELVEAAAKQFPLEGELLSDIAGIVFRGRDGRITDTGARPPLSMDLLPFPYKNMELFKNRIIYYESSRGCPFSCSYCLSSIDRHVRFRSMDKVKKELSVFLEAKVPQVKFVDRTFNCRHDRTLEIWRFIRDKDNGVTNFHFEITADLLNEEELELLESMRPGLVQLEIGVQSVNPDTLQAIQRSMDFEKLAGIVRRLGKNRNIHQHLDLIAGLPWEDMDSFAQSFNKVYSLEPSQLQLGFLKVLKGSPMHDMQEEYALVYRTRPVYEVMSTRWMSFDDILFLKEIEEMVEVYYNSAQFCQSLKYLEHFFEHPFELFSRLAFFYRNGDFAGRHYSRFERYELLRTFAAQVLGDVRGFLQELFDEILTYDLYLRENVKSRPCWAPDQTPWKKAVAAFYSNPAMIERYFKDYRDKNYRQIRNLTHVEVFHWDIIESAQAGEGRTSGKGLGAMVFYYDHKDCLTYGGRAILLEEELE